MYDLIEKKKRGGSLSAEEIAYMVREFVAGDIPDYQMSAMLMAVYFKGMDDREITDLTLEMAHSGDCLLYTSWTASVTGAPTFWWPRMWLRGA